MIHELSDGINAGELTLAVLLSMLEPFVTVSVAEVRTKAPPPYSERTRERPQRLLQARALRSFSFLETDHHLPLGESFMS